MRLSDIGSYCLVSVLVFCVLFCGSCRKAEILSEPEVSFESELKSLPMGGVGLSLFDGESMGYWKETDFEQEGKSYVEDGRIVITRGMDMSGVTWTGPLLRMNYEISLEAMRVDGMDFFCGLTFPINEDPCTFVVGGWGGTTVGLSNIDYYDAMNNASGRMKEFENNKWYAIRLRVTEKKIQAWIDDEMLVNFDWVGHKLDVRMEVEPSIPLGIATWQTGSAIRNIEVCRIDKEEESDEDWYY